MLTWSCIDEGAFRCSLNLSPKFLTDSPVYSSSHSTLLHLNLYMTPHFLRIRSLFLGVIRRFLMVGPPFRCTSMPYFCKSSCNSHSAPGGMELMCGLGSMLLLGLKFLLLLFFFFWVVVWLLIFTLLRAHVGTCISSNCCINALLLSEIGACQNRWFLPYGTESQSCYILMVWHDGCPNADTGLYV